MAEHEILNIVAPFVSGAFGAGIVWGYVRTKISELDRRVSCSEEKLENQVGDNKCARMRHECKADLSNSMTRIEAQLTANRDYVAARFVEIARFMGQHNGHA